MKISQFGLGTVGLGTYELIQKLDAFSDVSYHKIGIKNPLKERSVPNHLLTFQADEILNHPQHDVLIEAIDHPGQAYEYVINSLRNGIPVISASKKMIAEHLPELLEISSKTNTQFLYEAAVAGSIPILKILKEYYPLGTVKKISGILNGTCNYILSKIENEGFTYEEALVQAQKAGFAESDPSTDVGGYDSANKLSILIYHSFGIHLKPSEFEIKGISHITKEMILKAKNQGKRYKLIAEASLQNNEVFASVEPVLVDVNEQKAQINNEYNFIEIESDIFGNQSFSGKGAGAYATALAVLGDLRTLKKELILC